MMDLVAKILAGQQQRKLYVIGAAFVDLVMNTPILPAKGDDVFVDSSSITIGGCALNIARIHKSLGLDFIAGIPVGLGIWANHIRHTLEQEGIAITQERASGDNGWCIAIVEADGERTFLSSAGVESDWTLDHLQTLKVESNGIIYLSGYQLAADRSGVFLDWIETLDLSVSVVVDLGPRLVDISKEYMQRLYDRGVLFTLNRREAELMATEQSVAAFCEALALRCHQPVLYRVDKEGAFLFNEGQEPTLIPPLKTTVVDTIGAGDAHAAGFLYGLAMGFSYAEAASIGNAVASDAVEQEGASRGLTIERLVTKLSEAKTA